MGCGRESSSSKGAAKAKGCVCEVVRAILDIQNQAVIDDCSTCTTNCFLEPLGGISSPARPIADTRVFTLLNKDGSPFLASFSDDVANGTSIYFRVEDIFDGCCATLRVLIPMLADDTVADLLDDTGTRFDFSAANDVVSFLRSDSCVTVDLSCFCAVQCIADIDLNVCM